MRSSMPYFSESYAKKLASFRIFKSQTSSIMARGQCIFTLRVVVTTSFFSIGLVPAVIQLNSHRPAGLHCGRTPRMCLRGS